MYHLLSFIIIYHYLRPSSTVFFSIIIHTYYIYNIIIIIVIIIIVTINQLLWYVQYIYCMNSSSPPGALQSSPQCPRSDQRAPLRIPSPEEPATAPVRRSRGYAPWFVSPKERTRSSVVKRWNETKLAWNLSHVGVLITVVHDVLHHTKVWWSFPQIDKEVILGFTRIHVGLCNSWKSLKYM